MSESYNQFSMKNQRRRYTYLLLGIVFLAVAVFMVIFVYQVVQYFFAALVFLLGALLIGMFFSLSPKKLSEGVWTYKTSDKYREKVIAETRFVSIPWTRFYAAILLISIGILNYFFLGAYFGPPEDIPVEQYHGTALTLGNMSFFWLVGFPAFIIGAAMLVYSILTIYPGNISQSENIYYIHERRLLFPKLTEIAKTDVEALRYQNTNIGHRIIWIIYFVPTALLMLKYGVPMFDEPRAETHEFPIMMTLTAVIHFICLFLLVVYPQDYLELVSADKYYEMWFNPQKATARTEILSVLECVSKQMDSRGDFAYGDLNSEEHDILITREKQHKYFRLIMGLTILVISLVSYAFQIIYGALFWFGGMVFGLGLIIMALFTDFNTTQRVYYNQSDKKFFLNAQFGRKKIHVAAFKTKSVSLTPHLRKLKPFEVLSAMWVMDLAVMQTIYAYVYGDFSRFILILETIGTTILTIGLIFMLFLYFCVPINQLQIESETFTHYHEIPLSEEKFGPFKKPFKKIMKSRDWTFRVIFMGVTILIAIAAALLFILI
ncbi:MAG: hypothetical protein JW776_06905 [Candidatus Lokiarchaeota archaeon]|nr:hypothetical protein [Candidatus Lokiarchaeota archaeon]